MADDDRRSLVLRECVAHRGMLYSFVLGALKDFHRTEDVFQNVHVVICEKWSDFRPGTDFGAWARKIARFELLKEFDRLKRRTVDVELDMLEAAVSGGSAAEWNERREALRRCVGKLPERSRRCLALRYERGLSCPDTASALGVAVGALHTLLSRLRKSLAACVQRALSGSEAARA